MASPSVLPAISADSKLYSSSESGLYQTVFSWRWTARWIGFGVSAGNVANVVAFAG